MLNENYRSIGPGDAPVKPRPADGKVRRGDPVRHRDGETAERSATGVVTNVTRWGRVTVEWTEGKPSTVPADDLTVI